MEYKWQRNTRQGKFVPNSFQLKKEKEQNDTALKFLINIPLNKMKLSNA